MFLSGCNPNSQVLGWPSVSSDHGVNEKSVSVSVCDVAFELCVRQGH